MQPTSRAAPRRINWINVSTVLSAAILIAAEVFGAAFAGGWAFGNLFALGEYGTYILQVLFFVLGIAVMVGLHPRRHARRAVHHAKLESARAPRRRVLNKLANDFLARGKKTSCIPRTFFLFRELPNFARACGRVSVGGHPDKRPDSRLGKRSRFLNHATGSRRRNRRTPLSTGDAA